MWTFVGVRRWQDLDLGARRAGSQAVRRFLLNQGTETEMRGFLAQFRDYPTDVIVAALYDPSWALVDHFDRVLDLVEAQLSRPSTVATIVAAAGLEVLHRDLLTLIQKELGAVEAGVMA